MIIANGINTLQPDLIVIGVLGVALGRRHHLSWMAIALGRRRHLRLIAARVLGVALQ